MRVACLQVTSGPDMGKNIEVGCKSLRAAQDQGAELALMPENVGFLGPGKEMLQQATVEPSHPALSAFCEMSAKTGMWTLIGSLAVLDAAGSLVNRSFLVNGTGSIVARYDKIHMFDVDLPGGEQYRESDRYKPGAAACLASTPWATIGLTVCYDIRFPHLYRRLAQRGAQVFTVPSAFTRPTGVAHWHVLLRARAIENGCYVLAPAQCGIHYGKRATYGHSLIVDPWGEIMEDAGQDPGVIVAELDLTKVISARNSLPSLHHDRSFAM